jgi:DNA-binding NarL/FixJ family response regulator
VPTPNLPGPLLLVGTAGRRPIELAELMMNQGFDIVMAADAAIDRVLRLGACCVAAVLHAQGPSPGIVRTVARLHASWPGLPIVVLSDEDSRDLPLAVLRAGGDAYVSTANDRGCLELQARLRGFGRRGVLAAV